MKLSEKIRKLRKKAGFSQQKLADKVGIHITHISRLENAHYQPSLDVIKKLMDIFGVSADYFLNDNMDTYEVKINDQSLASKIRLIDTLEEKDREALAHVIDSMLTKQRMKKVLEETSATH